MSILNVVILAPCPRSSHPNCACHLGRSLAVFWFREQKVTEGAGAFRPLKNHGPGTRPSGPGLCPLKPSSQSPIDALHNLIPTWRTLFIGHNQSLPQQSACAGVPRCCDPRAPRSFPEAFMCLAPLTPSGCSVRFVPGLFCQECTSEEPNRHPPGGAYPFCSLFEWLTNTI
jgi:hypothetical protein